MEIKAFHIKASGSFRPVAPVNGTDFSLEELQHCAGGYIEIAEVNESTIMVINEEGKINGLPVNAMATGILRRNPMYANEVVVGDVLVCAKEQVK